MAQPTLSRRTLLAGGVGLAVVVSGGLYLATRATSQALRLGVINPQTGPLAAYGENVFRGMQIALKHLNDQGGINGRLLELIVEDDASNPANAATAFTKLATVDRVPLVVGPLSSGSSMATAALADRYKVVQLSTLAGIIDLTTAGDYVFRIYPSSEVGSRFLAQTAIDRFRATKVALLYANNAIGVSSRALTRQILRDAGVNVVADEIFADGDRDFRTQLTNIRTAQPELILSSAYYEDGAQILRQAGELGLRVPVMGEDSWFGPIAEQIGAYRELLYFADVDFESGASADSESAKFATAFQTKYGIPANAQAAAGHAALIVAANALKKAEAGDALKTAMYGTDLATAFGQVRFDPNGDNAGAKYGLYQLSSTNERVPVRG